MKFNSAAELEKNTLRKIMKSPSQISCENIESIFIEKQTSKSSPQKKRTTITLRITNYGA
jgi:hypothetical protein